MDRPGLTVSNFMEHFIGSKRVNLSQVRVLTNKGTQIRELFVFHLNHNEGTFRRKIS